MAKTLQQEAEEIARANQVVPLTNEFDESKSTAGRVKSIVDENSALMQQARTSGTQVAAARGLTNSSLAGQAAQLAVLDKATPIASQDAQLYSQNALTNLTAKNAAATTNANNATSLGATALVQGNQATMQKETLAQQADQFKTQAAQSQQQIDNQVAQFAQSLGISVQDMQLKRDQLTQQQQQYLAGLENQKAIASMQSDTTKAVAGLNRETQLQIAQLEQASRRDIEGNGNIAGAWGTTMQNIQAIQNNPNIEQGAKQTLIQNNIESFQSFTNFWKKVSGGTTDISDLLNFNIANATTPSGSAGAPQQPDVNPPSRSPYGVDVNGYPILEQDRGGGA